MKKMFNTVMTMFFAMCAIGTVAAQRGGHRSFSANRGGGHGGYTAHSVSHESGSVTTYRGSGYGHISGRGTAYRGGGYSHVSGGTVYHGGHAYAPAYGRRGFVARRRVMVPWGAAHRYAYGRPVYFPAYHLYYDPYRCGYTYWSGGRWLFSAVLPSIFAGIDLAAAQMAYANSLPQAYYPQDNGYYDDGSYDEGYAPAPVVPAPAVGLNIHIGL